MEHSLLTGALTLALLVMMAPALGLFKFAFGDWQPKPFRGFFRDLWADDAGVVVVTYCHPVLGAPTTTAPTGAQAALIQELTAQVFMADSDTAAVIAHNWGLPNSFPTWLWPQVFVAKSLGAAGDVFQAFTFGLTNTNSVTMTKGNTTAGGGGTYNVYIRRPHSIGQ